MNDFDTLCDPLNSSKFYKSSELTEFTHSELDSGIRKLRPMKKLKSLRPQKRFKRTGSIAKAKSLVQLRRANAWKRLKLRDQPVKVFQEENENTMKQSRNVRNYRLKEGNSVSGTLPPTLDSFLQDIAQITGMIDYTDIMNFGARATAEDVKKLRKLYKAAQEAAEYDDEDDYNDIARDVRKIVVADEEYHHPNYGIDDCSCCGSNDSTDLLQNYLRKSGYDVEAACDILEMDPCEVICKGCYDSFKPELDSKLYSEYNDLGTDTRTGEPFGESRRRLKMSEQYFTVESLGPEGYDEYLKSFAEASAEYWFGAIEDEQVEAIYNWAKTCKDPEVRRILAKENIYEDEDEYLMNTFLNTSKLPEARIKNDLEVYEFAKKVKKSRKLKEDRYSSTEAELKAIFNGGFEDWYDGIEPNPEKAANIHKAAVAANLSDLDYVNREEDLEALGEENDFIYDLESSEFAKPEDFKIESPRTVFEGYKKEIEERGAATGNYGHQMTDDYDLCEDLLEGSEQYINDNWTNSFSSHSIEEMIAITAQYYNDPRCTKVKALYDALVEWASDFNALVEGYVTGFRTIDIVEPSGYVATETTDDFFDDDFDSSEAYETDENSLYESKKLKEKIGVKGHYGIEVKAIAGKQYGFSTVDINGKPNTDEEPFEAKTKEAALASKMYAACVKKYGQDGVRVVKF